MPFSTNHDLVSIVIHEKSQNIICCRSKIEEFVEISAPFGFLGDERISIIMMQKQLLTLQHSTRIALWIESISWRHGYVSTISEKA